MKNKLILFAIAFLGFNSANATLIGDTVNVSRVTDTTVFYNESKVVSNAVEITDDISVFTMDITADSLVFTSTSSNWFFSDLVPPAAFYEWRFTDLNFSNGEIITGLDLSGFGYDPGRVSFTSDSVVIDINNFIPVWNQGDTWTIGMLTSAVPEPSIIALMALGLVGIGFTRRNKKV